jgi:hypothetical protein
VPKVETVEVEEGENVVTVGELARVIHIPD